MRALYVNRNKPIYAALLGFIESAIWIVAVSQVIKDINDPILITGYAGGFAAGTILGSYLERSIGIGNIVVRVFASVESPSVANALRNEGYGVTVINGEGKDGAITAKIGERTDGLAMQVHVQNGDITHRYLHQGDRPGAALEFAPRRRRPGQASCVNCSSALTRLAALQPQPGPPRL